MTTITSNSARPSPEKEDAACLTSVAAQGDYELLMICLRRVAQSRGGMTSLAKRAGVSRTSLYRALSPDSQPLFETVIKIADALDLRITFEPKNKTVPEAE
jgi:probable addiction module antidote protein